MHYMLTEMTATLLPKKGQDKLVETVLAGGKLNRKCVGRDAKTLLSMIGVQAPANTAALSSKDRRNIRSDHNRAYDANPRNRKS